MKYTLILAADPAKAPAPGSPEEGRFFQAFFAFNQEIEDKGVYLGGEPLQDVSTATTIRVVDGQPTATDGPFAETKEQIGGFYLLESARPGRGPWLGGQGADGGVGLWRGRGSALHRLLPGHGVSQVTGRHRASWDGGANSRARQYLG